MFYYVSIRFYTLQREMEDILAVVLKCLVKVAVSISTKDRARGDHWVILLVIPVLYPSECIKFYTCRPVGNHGWTMSLLYLTFAEP